MLLHHLGKVAAHPEFGNIAVIQAYVNRSVIVGIHHLKGGSGEHVA